MKYRFERYCKDYENIENYEKALADNFNGWCCHHRLETHTSDGERRLVDITRDELRALGMYYHRPASELIFLTRSEHSSLHKPSEETKKKMSEALKGEKNPNYGKHFSEGYKNKLSEALKGKHLGKDNPNYGKHHSEGTKKKISEAARINSIGRHWYNNGKENKFCYECPDGFVPGMLK